MAEEPIDSDDTVTAPSIYDPTLVFPDYATATTYREKIAATQLPESLLEIVTTEYLVRAVLSTPAIYEIFLASDRNYSAAFERIKNNFNTLVELESRSDSGTELLNCYFSLDFDQIMEDEGEYYFLGRSAPLLLEVLLGKNVHFNRLTNEQIQNLANLARITLEKKIESAIYGKYELSNFYNNLESSAQAAISSGLSEILTDSTHTDVTIYTYGGLSFGAQEWHGDDAGDAAAYYAVDKHRAIIEVHPNVIKIWDATEKYNCHSYAWYWESPDNRVWINDNVADTYIDCPSSIEKASPSAANIIVYFDSTGNILHSGIIKSVLADGTIIVESKWGDSGAYRHEHDDISAVYIPAGGYVKYYSYTVHKYDDWKYCDDSDHQRTCSLCRGPIQNIKEPHSWTLTKDIASHTFYCGICKERDFVAHQSVSMGDSKHKVDCTECGFYGEAPHLFLRWTTTATTHIGSCESCKHTISEAHILSIWGTLDEYSHERVCLTCGYSQEAAHILGTWTSVGTGYHRRTCGMCGYYVEEPHTPDVSNTKCTTCGYEGSFSVIASIRPGI